MLPKYGALDLQPLAFVKVLGAIMRAALFLTASLALAACASSSVYEPNKAPNVFGNPASRVTPDYPRVTVQNRTKYYVTSGSVLYVDCRTDRIGRTAPEATWRGPTRGLCLLTQVLAYVSVRGASIRAKEYRSSGTSFSRFAVIKTGHYQFQVIRI